MAKVGALGAWFIRLRRIRAQYPRSSTGPPLPDGGGAGVAWRDVDGPRNKSSGSSGSGKRIDGRCGVSADDAPGADDPLGASGILRSGDVFMVSGEPVVTGALD